MEHVFSTLSLMNFGVFAWLCVGVLFKRRPPVHMMLMTSGFALDTALLLYIELARSALGQLLAPMGPWLVVHIIIAVLLVPIYPMLIYSGGKVSAGKPVDFHKWLARTFFALRFLLWLTVPLAMSEKAAG